MASFKELEHRGWTEKAPFYDDHFAAVTRQAIEPMLSGLGNTSGRRLLDICCGTGDLALAATRNGARVVGVDFAAPMIEIAKRRVPSARFYVADAEALDIADGDFEFATCAFGLWHISEPEKAISEAGRVLQSGGRFSYSTWLPPGEGWDMMRLLMAAIDRHGTMAVDLPPAPPPFRFAQKDEAQSVLQAAGFGSISFHRGRAIWRGKSGEDLIDLVYKGIVRAPMLIDAQAPQAKAAILADLISGAEALRVDGEIRMNWPFLIVSATKT